MHIYNVYDIGLKIPFVRITHAVDGTSVSLSCIERDQ